MTAAAAGALAVTGSVSAAPVTLAEQGGVVRQIDRSAGWATWTRCINPDGPSEVWARRNGSRNKPVRVLRNRRRACDAHRLVGTWRGEVMVLAPLGADLKRLMAVGIRSRERTVIEAETPGPDGLAIVAADANLFRLAWIRVVGPSSERRAEVVVRDLRTGVDTVVHQRRLVTGAVRLAGVWVNARGDVVLHELLSGAQYGYGTGEERLRLRARDGRFRTIARVAPQVHVAAADLGGRRFVYSLVRENDRRVWVYGWDVQDRRRALLRVARSAPRSGVLTPPAVPYPRLYADQAVWRERTQRSRRGFLDTVRSGTVISGPRRRVDQIADVRRQRRFVGPPVIWRGVVTWSVTTYAGSGGWRGGYEGLSSRRARTTILAQRLPR